MRKMQLWAILKEIASAVDGWDQETFEKEMQKPEMTFAKFLPKSDNWHELEKHVVRIQIPKQETDEEKT